MKCLNHCTATFYRSMELFQYGILQNVGPVYHFNANNCIVKTITAKKKSTAINLNNLSGAFVILGIGVFSSLFLLILEKIVWMFRQRKMHLEIKENDGP